MGGIKISGETLALIIMLLKAGFTLTKLAQAAEEIHAMTPEALEAYIASEEARLDKAISDMQA